MTPMSNGPTVFYAKPDTQQFVIDGYQLSPRGLPQLICNGFVYSLRQRLPAERKIVWKCLKRSTKKCKAFMVVRDEKIVDSHWHHTHDPNFTEDNTEQNNIMFSTFNDLDGFLKTQTPTRVFTRSKCKFRNLERFDKSNKTYYRYS